MALHLKSTGIDFTDFGDATESSELLDDYEEGTWTVTHTDWQFSAEDGDYTKIGNRVNIGGYVKVGSGSSSGNAWLGLPFTVASDGGTGGGNCIWNDMATYQSRTHLFPRAAASESNFHIYCNSPSTGWSVILIPDTNNFIVWNMHYRE